MKRQITHQAAVGNKRNGIFKFIYDRFGLDSLNYEVPAHANTLPFTLGGITAVSLLLTMISGIVLAFWYVPLPEQANASIRVIMEKVYWGSMVRGIHYWSAQLTMIALVLHVLRVFLYGSYKKPREGNWLVGVLLFGVMVGLYFTGTSLKWDQEGFEALEHAESIAGTFGLGGLFSTAYVPVLIRLFIAHVSILPVLLVVLLFIHMLLVKRMKISELPWKKKSVVPAVSQVTAEIAATAEVSNLHVKKHTFVQHFRKLFGYGFIIFGIVVILAVLVPPSLGPAPLTGIEVTKPLWPFLWIYSVEEWFGINGAVIASTILFTGMLAVPFFDRGSDSSIGKRKWIVSVGLAVAIALLILTIYAVFSSPVVHLDME